MTDAALASLATAVTVIAVAIIQRGRDNSISAERKTEATALKEVADKTHVAVNSNWAIATERIDQLQEAMQKAGIKVPPTPPKGGTP